MKNNTEITWTEALTVKKYDFQHDLNKIFSLRISKKIVLFVETQNCCFICALV